MGTNIVYELPREQREMLQLYLEGCDSLIIVKKGKRVIVDRRGLEDDVLMWALGKLAEDNDWMREDLTNLVIDLNTKQKK